MIASILADQPERARFEALRARAAATHRTAQDIVRATLREAIAHGLLVPGARLRQEELAGLFATSRITVREALRALEHEGLLTSEPHRGFVVAGLEPDDVEEVFELRETLDTSLLRRALDLLDEADISRLDALLEAADGPGDDARADTMDAFWETLFAAAGRPRTSELSGRLRREVRRLGTAGSPELAAARAVLDCAREGRWDDAVAALASHYRRTSARLRRDLRSQAPS